jgi:hypothetical protein
VMWLARCFLPLSKACYCRSKKGVYLGWVASLCLKTRASINVWLFSPVTRGFLTFSASLSVFHVYPKLTIRPVVIEHVYQESLQPLVTTPFRKVRHFGYTDSISCMGR